MRLEEKDIEIYKIYEANCAEAKRRIVTKIGEVLDIVYQSYGLELKKWSTDHEAISFSENNQYIHNIKAYPSLKEIIDNQYRQDCCYISLSVKYLYMSAKEIRDELSSLKVSEKAGLPPPIGSAGYIVVKPVKKEFIKKVIKPISLTKQVFGFDLPDLFNDLLPK